MAVQFGSNAKSVPKGGTQFAAAKNAAAAATSAKASGPSGPPARGQVGWIDPVRAPGDTRYTDKFGSAGAQNTGNPNAGQTTTPTTPVDTSQPSPGSTPVTPASATVSGGVSDAQARANLAGGGLSGDSLAMAQKSLSAFQAAHANTTGPAPQDAGTGMSTAGAAVANATAANPDTSGINNFLSQDPVVNGLMTNIAQLLSPQQQTTSLMDDYNKLYKSSGLGDINKELIDANTVINGTEGDIRNEVQSAGGLGTDSQIQAMSLARNKSLIARVNMLTQEQTNAQNQLNTMMQLDSSDKQMAQARVNTQISTMFQLANFQQQATNNVKEAFNAMVGQVGYSGALQAYSQSPEALAGIEKVMGLPVGGLSKLASIPNIDQEIKQAQLENTRANTANTYSEINARNNPTNEYGTLTGKAQTIAQSTANGYADRMAQANNSISQLGSEFTGALAVGGSLPNFLQSGDRQAYEQAKRNFVNATLRQESGASIAPSEFDSAVKQYFPVAGDTPATVAQKAATRNTVINNFYREANVPRPVSAGDVIIGNDGKQYKVGQDGQTITPL